MAFFSPTALWGSLMGLPGMERVIAADAAHWRTVFAQDGLPEDRALVFRHAAEGLANAASVARYLDDRELAVARTALLALAGPA